MHAFLFFVVSTSIMADTSDSNSIPRSFTPLQQNRRIGGSCLPLTVACPSMDLIAVGTAVGPTSRSSSVDMKLYTDIGIHRSLSWQKLWAISDSSDLLKSCLETVKEEDDVPESHLDALLLPTACTWSPHGRSLAVGLSSGSILIYDVEASCHEASKNPSATVDLGSMLSSCMVTHLRPPPAHRNNNNNHKNNSNKSTLTEGGRHTQTGVSGQQIWARSAASSGQRKRLLRRIGKTPDTTTESQSQISLSSNTIRYGHAIVAMTWVRFSHTAQDSDKNSMLDGDTWQWKQRYSHPSSIFLPHSIYHETRFLYDDIMEPSQQGQQDSSFQSLLAHTKHYAMPSSSSYGKHSFQEDADRWVKHVDPRWPRIHTILNALCVLTSTQGIHVYLHGQYPILHIHTMAWADTTHYYSNTNQANILCTADLSTFVVWDHDNTRNETNTLAHVVTVPRIHKERYTLQIISSFYASITSHLSTIQGGMKDILAAWNTALRPLDTKLEPMIKLFKDYGVLVQDCPTLDTTKTQSILSIAKQVRLHLLQYVLRGHVPGGDGNSSFQHAAVSNALDQFFTHASMNDALLLKLLKTTQASLAEVESIARKSWMGPIQALVYDIVEFYGHVHGFTSYCSEDNPLDMNDELILEPLIDNNKVLELCKFAQSLRQVMEICLHQLVEVRFRVTNLIQWLRATAAEIKARGTPIDSIQREHAKKRRLQESMIRNITQCLSQPIPTCTTDHSMGWTEAMLGILWSTFHVCENLEYYHAGSVVSSPSVKEILEKAFSVASSMFHQPCHVLSKSTQSFEIILDLGSKRSIATPSLIAFHKRSRQLVLSEGKVIGFVPHLLNPTALTVHSQTQWIIAAICFDTFIELVAIPLDSPCHEGRYYLSSRLTLPHNCHVTDIQFYGDDGSAAFKVEQVETVEEGRQALGLIVERMRPILTLDNKGENRVTKELWLVDYDSFVFKCVVDRGVSEDMRQWTIKIDDEMDEPKECVTKLFTAMDKSEDGHLGACVVKSRVIHTKNMGSTSVTPNSRIIMNGPRGVGGLSTSDNDLVMIDLYDLEDDEDE